jgi:hypothetical protein
MEFLAFASFAILLIAWMLAPSGEAVAVEPAKLESKAA